MGKQVESVELKVENVGKFLTDMKAAENQYDKTTGVMDKGSSRAAGGMKKFSTSILDTLVVVGKISSAIAGVAKLITVLSVAKELDKAKEKSSGFSDALGAVVKGVSSVTSSIAKMAPVIGSTVAVIGTLTAAIGAAVIAIGAIVAVIAVVVAAFVAFTAAVGTAISAVAALIPVLVKIGEEGLTLAGRFEEAEISALAIGRAMGLTEQEIRSNIKAINDAGIRYDNAAETVAKLARYQIELANATDLVKVAQATGILIHEDSSETMERLTDAIVTGNTARLTALQITVDNQEALKAYAGEIGKNVKQLTKQEEMQARVNAILKQSKNLMDLYDESMKNPTKRLRSLTGRELPEMKAALMQAFMPALSAVIGDSKSGIRGFVNTLTDAMQEGGALYPILIRIGAAVGLLADAFSSGLDFVSQFIRDLDVEFSDGLFQVAENMFRWGAEIVAALAEGMVSAAYVAMTVMANTINSLMSFWFAPGSPPRAIPDIDKWGAATMTEYLRSFSNADFSVLKTVQSALGNFLSPEAMTKLSKALVGDIAAGGGAGKTFFDRIAKSAGVFGVEVAKLARLEMGLAKATKAMDDANRRYDASQTKIVKATHEYNALLRKGATQEELQAKLAEVRAAEQEKIAAAQEKTAATQDVSGLQKQLELQRQLVDQLAQLFKATSGVGTKGIAGSLGESLSEVAENVGPGGQWDITSKIGEAIDKMKEELKKKFKDIFKPLVDAWNNIKTMIFGEEITEYVGSILVTRHEGGMVQMFQQMVDDIGRILNDLHLKWSTFRTNLALIFIGIETSINTWVAKVRTWFTTDVPGYIEKTRKKLAEELQPALENVRLKIGGATDSIYEAITRLGEKLVEYLDEGGALGSFLKFIGEVGKKGTLLWALEKVIDAFWRAGGIIEGVTTVARVVGEAAKKWQELVDAFDKGTAKAMDPYIGHSPSPLEKGIRGAIDALPALAHQMRLLGDSGASFPVTTSRAVMGGAGANYNNSRSYQGTANVGPNYFNTPMDVATVEVIATRAVSKALKRGLSQW